MSDKPISITRNGDGSETATYPDGRTETRQPHVPTVADRWPRGEGTSHTPGRDATGKPLPKPPRLLRSAAYTNGAVHIFYSDGSREVVAGVSDRQWMEVRMARDWAAALAGLLHPKSR